MHRGFAIAALLTALAASPLARADEPDPNAYTVVETYFPSTDGTPLHAFVYRPAGPDAPARTPVILEVTPYAGSGGDPQGPSPAGSATPGAPGLASRADAFARGYAFVVVSVRGYGGSGGCTDLWGPNELEDVRASIAWSGEQPWSTGRVGMIGHSYAGGTGALGLVTARQAKLAGQTSHLAAVITGAPPLGYPTFFTNRVRNFGMGHLLGPYYAVSDLQPPSAQSPPEQHTTSLTGTATNLPCYAGTSTSPYERDPDAPYWRDRDTIAGLTGTTVPTMLLWGYYDFRVHPTRALDLYHALAGPRHALFGPWDHGIPGSGSVEHAELLLRWFDRYLKDLDVDTGREVRVQWADGRTREENAFPPAEARPWTLDLLPGSYVDLAGNNGETEMPEGYPAEPPTPLPTGRGSWTFTPPLDAPVHLSGEAQLTADVATRAPGVNLIGLLYDVGPDGRASLVTRAAYLLTGSGEVTVPFSLTDTRFEPGHRIGVLLTSADDMFFEPSNTGTVIDLRSATLTMPVLPNAHIVFVDGTLDPRDPPPPFDIDPATIAARTAS